MQISVITLLVLACGALGGLANALLAGDLHLPHREGRVYCPGWIGNFVVGAVAALVLSVLYRPVAHVPFTIAELVGAVVIGIGAGRILSGEVAKKKAEKTPARASRDPIALDAEMDALLDTVSNGSTFESLRAARQLERLTRKRRFERELAEAQEK